MLGLTGCFVTFVPGVSQVSRSEAVVDKGKYGAFASAQSQKHALASWKIHSRPVVFQVQLVIVSRVHQGRGTSWFDSCPLIKERPPCCMEITDLWETCQRMKTVFDNL